MKTNSTNDDLENRWVIRLATLVVILLAPVYVGLLLVFNIAFIPYNIYSVIKNKKLYGVYYTFRQFSFQCMGSEIEVNLHP